MKYDINLLPKKNTDTVKKLVALSILLLIIFASLLLVGFMIPKAEQILLNSEKDKKQKEIDDLSGVREEYTSLNAIVSALQGELNHYEGLKSTRTLLTKLFEDLEKNIPTSISVKSLGYNKGSFSFSGSSPNYKDISMLIVKLRELDYVANVTTSGANLEDNKDLQDLEEEEDQANLEDSYAFTINVLLYTFDPDSIIDEESDTSNEEVDNKEDNANETE